VAKPYDAVWLIYAVAASENSLKLCGERAAVKSR